MKQRKPARITILLLAILLVCFFVPSYALAASTRSNDNHTDTDDYCLRAHDVTIGLSEFQNQSRSELESDIISASDFAFLIRDTANETGEFVPITSGYSVNFSNLEEAATSAGYSVTVTLPAITLSEPSHITFRVYVIDDLPQPRTVSYTFESNDTGRTLPEGVYAQLPAEETILSGTTVTPPSAFSSVRDGVGQWTFSGWTPDSVTLSDSDVTFTGMWSWAQLPVYNVTFSFVSGTEGRSLPDGVLAKLPAPTTGYDGDVFTAPETFRAYHMTQGTWRFHGWIAISQTISGGDITFTGEWRWHRIKTSTADATATPAPTATPETTPTVAPITAATVSTSPEQPPAEPPELIPSDTQVPAANSTAGGTAQMVIATVLTALVATQAFAIAGDLKVLKWYNMKKTARRTGA